MAKFYDDEENDKYLRTIFKDTDYKGVFFDVGACKDQWLSISRHFIDSEWTVLSFEPNPIYYKELVKKRNNVYDTAISDEDKDNVNFKIYDLHGVEMAGLSGLELEGKPLHPEYNKYIRHIKTTSNILVRMRKLDTIIEEYNNQNSSKISKIDVLSIDVEGNELKVLQGLDIKKYDPTVLIIEECDNQDQKIAEYLSQFGYTKHRRHVFNNYYLKSTNL